MRRVLVTGAAGYVGQALVSALLPRLASGELEAITLQDIVALDDVAFDGAAHSGTAPAPVRVQGDLGQVDVLARSLACRPDTVFHLAGITSGPAEADFARGLHANLLNTLALFEAIRGPEQAACPAPPVLVFASSIGVFGTPLPARIDDDTAPTPTLSYGTQKRMIELLLADYSRRGWLDGRAVRLAGVVARPAGPNPALSGFASHLIREAAEGRDYVCPVGPDSTIWMLSLPATIGHLLQSARLPAAELPTGRVWTLPALRVSPRQIVQGLARRFGLAVAARVRFEPRPELEAQFARWPELTTATANRLGMHHDGDVDTLIALALARSPIPSPYPDP